MFVKKPKGKTPEELYLWCCELCEKINREMNEKETVKNGNNTKAGRS